jgi:multidrug resistance efflux pump
MPAKKLKKSPSIQPVARKTEEKTPKKAAPKVEEAKASVKKAKPAPKSANVSALTGGFIRISETRIQKVYR